MKFLKGVQSPYHYGKKPMFVRVLNRSGLTIVCVDYRSCQCEASFINVLYDLRKVVLETPGKLNVLVNIEGSFINTNIVSQIRKSIVDVFDPRVDKIAVIGVKGLKKIIFRTLNAVSKNEAVMVDTDEDGIKYFLEQSEDVKCAS